jgi:hypothetical protein
MNTIDSVHAYTGSCFCGGVEYEVSKPIKFVAHDHCSICRRISGSAFVTWCGVKADQFKLISGAHLISSFKSTSEAERQFCRTCGTHLFFRSSHWEGEVHFTLATIKQSMDELPKAHVFYSDKVAWLEINDELLKYGGTTGLEQLVK